MSSIQRIVKMETSNLCITCIKIGDKFDAEYVNKLYDMVHRQIDVPFFCFTDNTSGIKEGVTVVEIDVTEYSQWENWWPAWWKINMFVRPEIQDFKRKIFFDLDVIIHGDITKILESNSPFALVYSSWKGLPFQVKNPTKSMFNSSVIAWDDAKHIYDHWMQDAKGFVAKYAGTDDFYHNEKIKRYRLPPIIYSYRDGCAPRQENCLEFRPSMGLAILHQHPKNHELDPNIHIIARYWG